MDSDKPLSKPRSAVLVGKAVTIREPNPRPSYFTAAHDRWIGKTGRVHAVVAAASKENPLIKVGFNEGTQIVFFHLKDLDVHGEVTLEEPRRHGERGSHLP